MTVEQTGVVDIVSIDPESGKAILTISDHLDWSQSGEHQMLLQQKLNTYLAFVESGELLERYPKAKGKQISFNVVFKFKPDSEGRKFLAKAKAIVESAGYQLTTEIFAESYDN